MPSRRSAAFAEALARVGIKPQCASCGAPEKFPLTTVVLNDGEELAAAMPATAGSTRPADRWATARGSR